MLLLKAGKVGFKHAIYLLSIKLFLVNHWQVSHKQTLF